MKCPFCGSFDTQVVDSREVEEGTVVRRRRECAECKKRFTTYERVETPTVMVVKRDGRREVFNRDKIIVGIMKACEKRPISQDTIEGIANKVLNKIIAKGEKEVSSRKIGNLVMRELKKIDKIAYIRFASVYQSFETVDEFKNVIKVVEGSR
ncbi:transcriptional regulator NrdR [Nanoarchaeota archaeon]|nr:MAG: transcriptional regulator NrdR [Nanoarchaeota archaeon]